MIVSIPLRKEIQACIKKLVVTKFDEEIGTNKEPKNTYFGYQDGKDNLHFNAVITGRAKVTNIRDAVIRNYVKIKNPGNTQNLWKDLKAIGHYLNYYLDNNSNSEKQFIYSNKKLSYIEAYLLYIYGEELNGTKLSLTNNIFSSIEAVLNDLLKENLINEYDKSEQNKLLEIKIGKPTDNYYFKYRFYYYDNKRQRVLSQIADVYPESDRVIIPSTPSGVKFVGRIDDTPPVFTSMILNNESVNNEISDLRRLYILLNCDLNKRFTDQELSSGVYVNMESDYSPTGGKIIFQKLREVEIKSPDHLDDKVDLTIDLEAIKPEIELFLKNSVFSVKENIRDFETLSDSLEMRFPDWLELQKKLIGSYTCYLYYNNKFIVTKITVAGTGQVNCKIGSASYKGSIQALSLNYAIFVLSTTNRYLTFFLRYDTSDTLDELTKIDGVYVRNEQQTTYSGRFIFNRILNSDTELKFNKFKINDEFFMKNVSGIMPDFKAYFLGDKDDYLEKPNRLINDFNSIRFSDCQNSEYLKYIEGTYEYFRASTTKNGNVLRKFPVNIEKDGYITVKGKETYQGKVFYYHANRLLYIHFFNIKKQWNDIEDSFWEYDTLFVVKLPSSFPEKTPKLLVALYVSTNHWDKEQICGKTVFIRREKIPLAKLKYKDEIRPDSLDYKKLNENFGGLGNYLIGKTDNFIKISNREIESFYFDNPNFEKIDWGEICFNSACFLAKNEGNKADALQHLQLALENGFRNEKLIRDELNGSLKKIKNEVLERLPEYLPNFRN